MAKTYVPVNGRVVAWAIDESGVPLEDLAEKIKVDPTVLQGWIRGEIQPSKGEFTRMVDALRRPSALFFSERVPQSSALPDSLRSAPGRNGQELVELERRWVRRALRIQKVLSFLGSQRGLNVDLPQVGMNIPPETAAARVREWLEVTVDDQVSQESAYAAWQFWRERLEHKGFLVFSLQFGPENIRGFSSWDEVSPVIAVNTAYNPQARIFTAMHEVGHLALRSEAACADITWTAANRNKASLSEERWCEEFAASVLLPKDAVMDFVDVASLSASDGFELSESLASKFNVSIRAAAIRLIRLGIEGNDLYAVVNERARVLDKTKGFARGRPQRRVQRRVAEYGKPAVQELLQGTSDGLLNLRDLRDYLRVDSTEVDEISQLVVGG